MIKNPIIPGFHPDPSACRVKDDYYIATSTFEWWPGVDIYHSKDLVNWEWVSSPLNRISQLDMRGNHDSGGIFAPNLTYSDGLFWLVYTDVKSGDNFHNYIVTCGKIGGDWSEPVFINSSGFDPSLYHDDDGRKYFVNMLWDFRQGKETFGGVVIQEYDSVSKSLTGDRKICFKGTDLGFCEGPQIIKRNGYYYLLCAEGGTDRMHAATVARSRDIMGDYELSIYHPLLSARYNSELTLQKSGHASFLQFGDDEWYITHLCSRELESKHCPLGRETAIQRIVWENDWPRLKGESFEPKDEAEAPISSKNAVQKMNYSTYCDFDKEELPYYFKVLRQPLNAMSLIERKGYLRLYGRDSLGSMHEQSLAARRFQSFSFKAETKLEFYPDTFEQMAGLAAYYNTKNWLYLYVTYDEMRNARVLNLKVCDAGSISELPQSRQIGIPDSIVGIYLKAEVDYEDMDFYYSFDNISFKKIGDTQKTGILSEDYVYTQGPAFTGAFIGICCQDLNRRTGYADFDYFNYIET